jgi:hypothetical protein
MYPTDICLWLYWGKFLPAAWRQFLKTLGEVGLLVAWSFSRGMGNRDNLS